MHAPILRAPGGRHAPASSLVAALALLCALGAAGHAAADTLPITGALTTQAGGPVTDGAYGVEVTLFADEALQQVVYQQAFVGVEVQAGRFTVVLGEGPLAPPFGGVDIAQTAAFVQVKVDSEPPLAPVPLHPVLRAFRADYATDAGSAQVALTAQVAKSAETAALADKAALADVATAAGTATLGEERQPRADLSGHRRRQRARGDRQLLGRPGRRRRRRAVCGAL